MVKVTVINGQAYDGDLDGGTLFAVHGNYVCEWWTPLKWSPEHPQGYQGGDGESRRIALTSYEALGCDGHVKERAERWCKNARIAWEHVHGALGK